MWFGVKVYQRAKHERSPSSQDLFEEIIFLVQASDEEEAKRRALQHAKRAETQYENVYGEIVSWDTDTRVVDVFCMLDEQPQDGSEVYSRFFYKLGEREISPQEFEALQKKKYMTA
jgi:hypothetical protein